MENKDIQIYDIVKYIIYVFIAIWTISSANAQQSCVERSMDYHILNTQKNSNFQMIKMLENQKQSLSVMKPNESIQRSRIQAVIGAKQQENFRLQRKMDYLNK
jgi:hypothetical protein